MPESRRIADTEMSTPCRLSAVEATYKQPNLLQNYKKILIHKNYAVIHLTFTLNVKKAVPVGSNTAFSSDSMVF